jgi:ABC-type oligopeptide transport system ATPase subunit
MPAPLLELENLQKYYPVSTGTLLRRKLGWVKAVDGVDFAVWPGETLGLIGESGCGKTTTSKLILLQESPTAGTIRFGGKNISALQGQELMRYRREVQVVFQDPYSSLSPRMRVGDIVAEPLEIHTDLSREALHERVAEVLELVGLQPEVARLFPHEFSGGQRQRIAIARALATHTRLIVLDEPVSALDVSIRAQIMNQLEHLQQTLGVSYLFIGHDLATVAHISHRIAVMYLGQIVELADSLELCATPLPLYPGPLCRSLAVSPRRQAREADDHRGGSERAQSALGLPFPSALSACHAAMRARGAGPQRSRSTSHRGLPSLLTSFLAMKLQRIHKRG